MNVTELLMHPVRLRIIFAAMDGKPFTRSEMCLRLPDVPKASLYRHIAMMVDGELLEVEGETFVHGNLERRYRLLRVRAVIDPAAAAAMTNDDHRRGFAAATASLLAEFNSYLDRPESNPASDSVSYRQLPLWLTNVERAALVDDISAAIEARASHEQSAERKRHLLSTVFFPAESQPRPASPDEGDEETERRLTRPIRDFK